MERKMSEHHVRALQVGAIVLRQHRRVGLHVVIQEEQEFARRYLSASVAGSGAPLIRLLQNPKREGCA